MIAVPSLPAEVAQGLGEFVGRITRSAGTNLQSLILYGGAARGRFHPVTSDLNLLVLLNDAALTSLLPIIPILDDGLRMLRIDPFIVALAELPNAVECFPTKFLEIRKHHLLLAGTDPFPSVQISRPRALNRIEQELLNMGMRLRRRYLAVHASPDLMLQTLRGLVVPLAVTLDAILELNGQSDPAINTRGGVLRRAADVLGLDQEAMKGLAALRGGIAPELDPELLYSRVIDSIARAARCCVSPMQEAT